MADNIVSRCIVCDYGATDEEITRLKLMACPRCGHKGRPCDPVEDIQVKVNWHELRILAIWAERWANWCAGQSSDDSVYSMPQVVFSIARRLEV